MSQPTQVVIQGGNRTLTDRSGTLTGATQVVMAANPIRDGFSIQNNGAAAMWINEIGGAATAAVPSIQIAAGATYVPPAGGVSGAQVSIIGTATQTFTAREW